MPHYKDAENKLYWLDNDADAEQFLPKDALKISDAEAEAITAANNPAPNPILLEILRLEASVTPRRLREALIGDNGWLSGVEDEIARLRGEL
jgi:hypothetical protein